jgi:hypothetical protein
MSEPEIDYNDRLTQLEEKIKEITQLEQRIKKLEDRLTLVTDIDRYQKLQEFLEAKQFKAADLETKNLILAITGHRDMDDVTPVDIKQISCDSLRVIDRLWLNNSEQRFGYSVQLGIYLSLGGNAGTLQTQDIEIFQKYGDAVSWRVNNQWEINNYDNWDFSLEAPRGCFPAVSWQSAYGLKMATNFLTRLLECELKI